MKSVIFAAAAAVALSACSQNKIDAANAVVRQGPQTQNPWADAPGGKLPTGDAGATPVIIDDSGASAAPATTGGSIFE